MRGKVARECWGLSFRSEVREGIVVWWGLTDLIWNLGFDTFKSLLSIGLNLIFLILQVGPILDTYKSIK